MKYSRNFKIGLVLSFVTLLGLSSCDNVLPIPTISGGTGSSVSAKIIETPENVRATHGKKGIITISWTPISNAQYYFIYKANSPHDTYVQIDEAQAGATSLDIQVPAGTSGYFKVAAVDAYDHISDMSLAVYGTSLATPIITAIEESLDSATVYWYMMNVSADSYLSTIRYNINCYNTDGSLKSTKTLSATEDTMCVFENLNSATKYFYEVEAYILSAQENVEKSLKLDSETAVNLIPKAAEFTVSEGDYTNKVELKIKLPEIGNILAQSGKGGASASSYETRPIYFVIQRQEKIEGNTSDRFETVCSYLNFKGLTTQIVDENIPKADYEDGSLWNDYTEGNEIIYADVIDQENRGKQYEYRVLSFIDCYCSGDTYKAVNKIPVTHDVKKAFTATGWAAANPKFFVSRDDSTYVYEDETVENPVVKYKSADSVAFKATWNDLNKASNYLYLLYENHRKLKGDNGGNSDPTGTNSFVVFRGSCYFESLDLINSYIRTYEYTEPDPNDEHDTANAVSRGYYKYTLCIVPKKTKETYPNPNENISSVYDGAFIKVEDLSNIAITNGQGQAKSNITNVVNGYKNKTSISFDFEDSATYKLKRNILVDGSDEIDATVESVIIPLVKQGQSVPSGSKSFTVSGTTATVEDTDLISGKRYTYSLFAANADFEDNESMSQIAETLGTPVVNFDKATADYNTITVKWNKVQQASKYKVVHNGKTWTVDPSVLEAEGEQKDVIDENGEYEVHCVNGTAYSFVIKSKAIKDFNTDAKTISAKNAGENLTVKVDAISDADLDLVETTLNNVYVLGPAQIDLKATEATSNYMIKVDWKMIDGISNYALQRTCPDVNNPGDVFKDLFYISSKDDGSFAVSINGEGVDTERISIITEGDRIILSDKHVEATSSSIGYQVRQEQIAWGHEYIYSVIPVKPNEEGDPFDETFVVSYQNITDTTSNGTAKKGYTSGYGLNVVASKSDSPNSIHVTWQAPNSKATLKPQVWVRNAGSTENWKSLGNYAPGINELDVTLGTGVCSEFDRCAKVEFAVNYEQNKTVNFKDSYMIYLSEKGYVDLSGNLTGNEPDNVGYEFTLQEFYADAPNAGAETFTEKVNWTLWNASNDNRKNAPGDGIEGDCYEIYVLNKNCSSKWYKIATVSKEGKVTSTANSISWSDVKVSGDLNYLEVTPNNMNSEDKVHDGLLKVQRDYKHYYKIVAKRKNSSGDVVSATLGAFDSTEGVDEAAKKEIFSYRKITNGEFGKLASLIVADSMHRAGTETSGLWTKSDATYNGYKGNIFFFYHYQAGKKEWYYTYTSYQHIFSKLPGQDTNFVSPFVLNCSESERGRCYSNKVYGLGSSVITVTNTDVNLSCYSGTINISCGTTKDDKPVWTLVMKYKNGNNVETTVNTSNENTFKQWFPFALAVENKSSNEGIDSKFPTMQGEWWEVRN